MAEKDVLSQEEIDALLESVDDTAESDATPAVEAQSASDTTPKSDEPATASVATTAAQESVGTISTNEDSIKSLIFGGQDRIIKGLPVLDKIHDRAMRLFTTDIYNLTATDFEIKQDPLTVIKHKEFMLSLPNPSLMTVYKFAPLRGKGMVIFDSIFIYDVVDYYFGGSSQFMAQKDKLDYTATELRVMESVTKKLIDTLVVGWKPIIALEITKFTEETNPQLVNIAEPTDILLVTRFSINFGKESGSFYLVIPYAMIEPIKQQLELGASRPDDEIDPDWIRLLREELMDVELTVSSKMAQSEDSLGNVMTWKAGDFIPMELFETVTLDIEGIPCFVATLGNTNEKRALKIVRNIRY